MTSWSLDVHLSQGTYRTMSFANMVANRSTNPFAGIVGPLMVRGAIFRRMASVRAARSDECITIFSSILGSASSVITFDAQM